MTTTLTPAPTLDTLNLTIDADALNTRKPSLIIVNGIDAEARSAGAAAVLQAIIDAEKNILAYTVQDQPRYAFDDLDSKALVVSRELGQHFTSWNKGLDMATHAHSNVILVDGKDYREYIAEAIHAANTGHTVIVTVEAADPIRAVGAIKNAFRNTYLNRDFEATPTHAVNTTKETIVNTRTPLAPRHTTATPIAALLDTDGYKLSHKDLYPQAGTDDGDGTGTTRIFINWTNRSNKFMPGSTHAVVFGLQAFVQSYLVEAWAPFFAADEDEVVTLYDAALTDYLGPNPIGSDHIRALHKLGYLPLSIKALPEGTLAPIGVATLTIENTHDAFFWLPNYIETALSASIWHPGTVATIALEFRELLESWALRTDPEGLAGVDFQAHDFSMRGQTSIDSAAVSGMGHLTSFLGTDSMPSIDYVKRYYTGDNGMVAGSVPATEHSVMCIRGQEGELATFRRILDVFKTGVVSAVADGYDLFKAITEVLPQLKDEILARDGKLVIRPDSGDPVDIMTGTKQEGDIAFGNANLGPEEKGVVELLGDIFGYTVNAQGYKVLNKRIGVIYGDSMNLDRTLRAFQRLEAKGWASTNIVIGIGSFTYQYVTRDNLGSAVKATWAMADGIDTPIQKDPKTGGAGKKSAKGRIALHRDETGEIYQVDEQTIEESNTGLLELVWEDGYFYKHESFADVRATLKRERAARAERNKELAAA